MKLEEIFVKEILNRKGDSIGAAAFLIEDIALKFNDFMKDKGELDDKEKKVFFENFINIVYETS